MVMILVSPNVFAVEGLASQKRHEAILKELALTPSEEAAFWPLYESYSAEIQANFNQSAEAAFRLYRNRGNVSDSVADDYTSSLLNAERRQADINLEYQPKFRKVLDARKTARLFQFERRLGVYMQSEILKEFPLVR